MHASNNMPEPTKPPARLVRHPAPSPPVIKGRPLDDFRADLVAHFAKCRENLRRPNP